MFFGGNFRPRFVLLLDHSQLVKHIDVVIYAEIVEAGLGSDLLLRRKKLRHSDYLFQNTFLFSLFDSHSVEPLEEVFGILVAKSVVGYGLESLDFRLENAQSKLVALFVEVFLDEVVQHLFLIGGVSGDILGLALYFLDEEVLDEGLHFGEQVWLFQPTSHIFLEFFLIHSIVNSHWLLHYAQINFSRAVLQLPNDAVSVQRPHSPTEEFRYQLKSHYSHALLPP